LIAGVVFAETQLCDRKSILQKPSYMKRGLERIEATTEKQTEGV